MNLRTKQINRNSEDDIFLQKTHFLGDLRVYFVSFVLILT